MTHRPDLKRYMAIVNAYRAHDERPKDAYIAEIRAKHGEKVAEEARRELVRFARSGAEFKA